MFLQRAHLFIDRCFGHIMCGLTRFGLNGLLTWHIYFKMTGSEWEAVLQTSKSYGPCLLVERGNEDYERSVQ